MISQIHLHQTQKEEVIRYSLNNAIPAIEKLHQALITKGTEFIQNHKIGNYCFDFYCPTTKVAIEIDGYAHEFSEVYSQDQPKKLYVQSLDITVFRFTDYQILTDIEEIFRALKYHQRFSKQQAYVV